MGERCGSWPGKATRLGVSTSKKFFSQKNSRIRRIIFARCMRTSFFFLMELTWSIRSLVSERMVFCISSFITNCISTSDRGRDVQCQKYLQLQEKKNQKGPCIHL